MRNFRVFTSASIADPTHQIAVSEFSEEGSVATNFSHVQALIDAAIAVECARAESIGFQKGTEHVFKLFGLTREQYMDKLKIK